MGHAKVKDMSRRQQKAVFANMSDDGYLRRLESAEQYHKRVAYLKNKHDLAETTEDKLFDVWNNKSLTHRQKMTKVAAIKADAAKKLKAYQKVETGATVTGQIRATQSKRFVEKYGIAGVKKTDRASLEELESGAKYEYKYANHKTIGMASARALAAKNLKSDHDYYKKKYKKLGEDKDKDGTANFLDCEPNNPKKQHDDLARYAAGKEHIPTTSKKSVYLIRFVDKKTKLKKFKEVSATSRKDARKVFLNQTKNAGVISISKKTPRGVLLEKKLARRDAERFKSKQKIVLGTDL
ncbi:unnamed protein product, partial [marine sediment metagenome]